MEGIFLGTVIVRINSEAVLGKAKTELIVPRRNRAAPDKTKAVSGTTEMTEVSKTEAALW